MDLKLFNPFARYIVVEVGNFYYSDHLDQVASVNPVRPVHYSDDLRDAEHTAHGLTEARESQYASYEVYENAAWKALDKNARLLKLTGYGEQHELPGIDRQLGVAAEVLHDMLEPPIYPEETVCETCGCTTGSFTKELCDSCLETKVASTRKCSICGDIGCLLGRTICARCDALGQIKQRPSGELYYPVRDKTPTALERTDEPDSPTAKPEGSAVWAKADK